MTDQEAQWAELMRAGLRGDTGAYRHLLTALAPVLRGVVRRTSGGLRLAAEDIEDIVQETLLALHLKRHTWDERQRLLPWVKAIARNKMIDSLRRRGASVHVPIDDFSETLADAAHPGASDAVDAMSVIEKLKGRDREIVVAMSVAGASAREVAERLDMTEGAVRVALHRALQSLAKHLRANQE